MDRAGIERLRPVIETGIVPVLERCRAAAVDGGTLSGVMGMLGEARSALGAGFPLVGVVAEGTLDADGRFQADTVLAKHDENYMPAEVARALKEQGVWKGGPSAGASR